MHACLAEAAFGIWTGISPTAIATTITATSEHRHQWKKKGVKPVFGGKSSATSVGCDPTFGAKSQNSVAKIPTFSTRILRLRC
jgi:hypothetical protein